MLAWTSRRTRRLWRWYSPAPDGSPRYRITTGWMGRDFGFVLWWALCGEVWIAQGCYVKLKDAMRAAESPRSK